VTPSAIPTRSATPADYDSIGRVTVEAYQEFAPYVSSSDWEDARGRLLAVSDRAKEARLIVAEEAEDVVGAVAYFPPSERRSEWVPEPVPVGWAYIAALAVLPTHRRRGIGNRLAKECLDRAKRDAALGVGLVTSEIMVAATRLWESLSFERQEGFVQYGIPHWWYALLLDDADR
jgi:predicted N-acetyltransferase YhbS